MVYNFKRALGISVVLYLCTFVVGVIALVASGVDMSATDVEMPNSTWYVGMVSAVILTSLFTLWYFGNKAIIPSAKSGLFFGLTSVLFGFVLDMIFFGLGSASGVETELGDYYGDHRYWITLVLVVLTAMLVGIIRSPKASEPTAPTMTAS